MFDHCTKHCFPWFIYEEYLGQVLLFLRRTFSSLLVFKMNFVDHSCFLFLLLLLLPLKLDCVGSFWQVWGWRYTNGFSLQGRWCPLWGGLSWPLSDLGITFVTCHVHINVTSYAWGFLATKLLLLSWSCDGDSFLPSFFVPFSFLSFIFAFYFSSFLFSFPSIPFFPFLPSSLQFDLPSILSLSFHFSVSLPSPLSFLLVLIVVAVV